eukprot:CAMPEP_0194049266 /NCGR_PEP_ID=MMETSP0009_2-20130614/30194_1 /TAXON_ID=210454 /ORGANISM="Grammatophora oceanica, Strain CCMP 410" /LENGTH=47 /DNA_ID= /DNA_START= /DNA_END= /DNA_ORIENTATION=
MIDDPTNFVPHFQLPDSELYLLDPTPDVPSTSAKAILMGAVTRELGQ